MELFVNGQSVGKGRKQQSGVFVWDDVKLDDMNTIKAVGTSDGQTYSDEVSGIKAENKNSATSIKYQTHIQSIGWQEAKKDGQTSGTIGKGLRMEALKVKLQNKNTEEISNIVHILPRKAGRTGKRMDRRPERQGKNWRWKP